jgi:hypothetical protein
MNDKIKAVTQTITTPDKQKTLYQTTDGTTFDWQGDAISHQRYLDSIDKVANIPHYYDWFLCKNDSDLNALFDKESHGKHRPSGTEHYPLVIKINAVYQDRDNYWITRSETLYPSDLKILLTLITTGNPTPTCLKCGSSDLYDDELCWDCTSNLEAGPYTS